MFDKNLTVFVVICSAILCSKITNKKVFANVIENNEKHLLKEKINDDRLEMVKEMAKSAWQDFYDNNLTKLAVDDFNNTKNNNFTLLDWAQGRNVLGAMTTLHVMGLEKEFAKGLQWVKDKLYYFDQLNECASLSEVYTEYIGSLQSLHALIGDKMLLNRLSIVAKTLLPAYNTLSCGLPFNTVCPKSKTADGVLSSLSTVGGNYLEAFYLKNPYFSFMTRSLKSRILQSQQKLAHLKSNKLIHYFYPKLIDVMSDGYKSDKFTFSRESVGGFYRGLLGSYSQSNKQSDEGLGGLQQYTEAIENIIKYGFLKGDNQTGLGFAYEGFIVDEPPFADENYMNYDTCYVGGMLALGANQLAKQAKSEYDDEVASPEVIERHWKLATQIAETCYQASTQTETKLGPESFSTQKELQTHQLSGYNLSSELAETNFLFWRLTGDTKYQERAWEMVTAIKKYCQTPTGSFAPIRDVNNRENGGGHILGKEIPIFLSATLKYLYLTFADKNVLSLDKWVFNAVGHPLPVCTNFIDGKSLCF